jgi:23S rRNA A1618 N6-methylase RlmF
MNPDIKDRIQIINNPDSNSIFPDNLILDSITPKFVVCNPPFYTCSNDLETRRAFKRHKPTSGRWEMRQEELGTELGGEIGFIKKLIQESIELKEKNIK